MSAARIGWPAVFVVAFILFVAVQMHLQVYGFASASSLDLWGRSLLAVARQSPFRDVVTVYPPTALMGMIILDWLLPQLGPLTPAVLTAGLAATLAASWFTSLRTAGLGFGIASAATALLALNPLFLRGISQGAGFMLAAWGFWILATGMFNLRRRSRVNDVMAVSFALFLLGTSGKVGLVFVLASLPFLALVISPELIAKSPLGVYQVLLFPFVFASAGFLFVNLMFTGDPLHFVSLPGPSAFGASGNLAIAGASFHMVSLALAGTAAACPIAIWGLVRFRRIGSLAQASAATVGLLVAAELLCWSFGILPAPSLVASFGCVLAASTAEVCARYGRLQAIILPSLFLGFVGGAGLAMVDFSNATARWRTAALMRTVQAPDPVTEELGQQLRGKSGILFDAAAAPGVVAARGSAVGIDASNSDAFQLAILTHRLSSEYVVVRNAEAREGADALGQAFPELFSHGAVDYRMIYDSPTWRIYQLRAGPKQ